MGKKATQAEAKPAPRLPQQWYNMTHEETRALQEWYISLPLKELRERQAMTNEQIGWCYDRSYFSQGEYAPTFVREGMKRLFIQQKHLDVAILVQHFEGGVLTDDVVEELMHYQARIKAEPIKPHWELPVDLT